MTFKEWEKEQDNIVLERQKQCPDLARMIIDDQPYYGAIGGAISIVQEIDENGKITQYAIHGVTNSRHDLGEGKINKYDQEYLDKIYKPGHKYLINGCGTSIGYMLSIKDLTTGEEINNLDDI